MNIFNLETSGTFNNAYYFGSTSTEYGYDIKSDTAGDLYVLGGSIG